MERQRVALVIYVDLDPVPGTFHTKESAQKSIGGILDRMIPHYNPMVVFGSKDIQPINRMPEGRP